MARIRLSKLRWIPLITQIHHDYQLTYQQSAIYGYIFNHCMNINDDGYIGYSDEHMAEELGISYERFRKELYVLRDKNLIIIQNPGKRTKQTGASRMIHINTSVFIDEEQLDLRDIEVSNLRKENDDLKRRLEEYRQHAPVPKNLYTEHVISAGVIPEKDHDYMRQMLAVAYEGMAKDIGHAATMNHVSYVIMHMKTTKPDNPVAYLIEAFKDYSRRTNGL